VEKVEQAKLTAPAIIVVGEVVTLRENLRWFDKKPLFGKNIIITRAREQASDLSSQLTELGANVIEFPTIEIKEPDDFSELDNAIENLENYDFMIFTSVNGVILFFKRLFYKGFDARKLANVKICAIGPKTAKQFENFGIKPDVMPKKYQAEYIIEELEKLGIKGKKFLLPRAKVAREILPEKIREKGGVIDVVTVYKTVLPDTNRDEVLEFLKENKVDYITFTSSSTVKNFFEMFKNVSIRDYLSNIKLVSIGPITSSTLRELGYNPSLEAEKFTIEGIVKAIMSDN